MNFWIKKSPTVLFVDYFNRSYPVEQLKNCSNPLMKTQRAKLRGHKSWRRDRLVVVLNCSCKPVNTLARVFEHREITQREKEIARQKWAISKYRRNESDGIESGVEGDALVERMHLSVVISSPSHSVCLYVLINPANGETVRATKTARPIWRIIHSHSASPATPITRNE